MFCDRQKRLKCLTHRRAALAAVTACTFLNGCSTANMPMMNPTGFVGEKGYDLLLLSTAIMAAIVVPIIIGTLWIVWRYRASTQHKDYDPEFYHSPRIDFITIFVPLITVAVLGALTWSYTHRLDPYQPLGTTEKPYEIQAISLDFKWLFVYPEAGVATINELVAPTGQPVTIRITSDPMMTSIFIPGLINQIYAMPGMETRANFLAPKEAQYEGANAMYSGPGFSKQRFATRIVSGEKFDAWLSEVKSNGDTSPGKAVKRVGALDIATYEKLAEKTLGVYPVTYFNSVTPNLFTHVARKYMPGYTMNPLPTAEEYRTKVLGDSSVHPHSSMQKAGQMMQSGKGQ